MGERKRTVKELMVPIHEYPVIYDDDTIKEGIKSLKKYLDEGKEYRSLLVFSRTKKVSGEEELVGILTVRDILNALKSNRAGFDNNDLFNLSMASIGWAYLDPVGKHINVKVGKIVRPLVKAFIQSNESVTSAVESMMGNNVNILPVYKGKKAVGIIRALDVLDCLGELL